MKGAKFLILISAVLFGCSSGANRHGNSDGLTVIDVGSDVGKGRVVNLSEIAQEITYIPLETTNDSYIGMAPVVYFENERIYVKSRGVIKVFDMSGKYLFTFDRRGRGPEEYIYSAPKIERGTGKFYAESPNSDRSVTVRIYTREGDYEKEFTVPSVKNRIISLDKSKENFYSFSFFRELIPGIEGIEVDVDKVSRMFYDTLSNLIGYLPNLPSDPRVILGTEVRDKTEDGRKLYNPSANNTIPQSYFFYKDTIRTYKSYNDTLYSFFDGDKLVPRYLIDYGEYAASEIDLDKESITNGEIISVDHNHYYETDKFILFSLFLRNYAHEPYFGKNSYLQVKEREIRSSYGYYDKTTGKFTLLNLPVKKTPGFRDDLEQGPPFLPSYLSDDNHMATIFYAHTLKEYVADHEVSDSLRAMIDNLDESDNPVIALVKLK
ncbi:MAG: 6-bladed beta-propeller [Bacteroidia bacterium]|nr:6-bladed beta-propeller [Bacteroidia bacterium]